MAGADVLGSFLAALEPGVRAKLVDHPALESELAAAAGAARAAHPGLALDAAAFAREIALRLDVEASPLDALRALHAPDLHLALACARADPAALAAFERSFGADVDRAADKSRSLGVDSDELRQLLRARLFVAEPGRAPRISTYTGKGALKSWVRVTAARLVVDLSRSAGAKERPSDGALLDRLPAGETPEVAYLRHAYAGHVPEAFGAALGRLTVRQRNLLRQRYLHGLGADKLAALYGVHRATSFGWLEEARLALLANLRAALRERVAGVELESLLALLGSDLEISVRRLLDGRLEDDPRR
jgi:RNA polymerase sigma-70 factor, ECF subfamily